MEHSIDRWVSILRHKASQYEHQARHEGKGDDITYPDIDCICNEMLAFRDGFTKELPNE